MEKLISFTCSNYEHFNEFLYSTYLQIHCDTPKIKHDFIKILFTQFKRHIAKSDHILLEALSAKREKNS